MLPFILLYTAQGYQRRDVVIELLCVEHRTARKGGIDMDLITSYLQCPECQARFNIALAMEAEERGGDIQYGDN